MTVLSRALDDFVATYHAAEQLVEQHNEWDSKIALVAEDSGETITLEVEQGRVSSMGQPMDAADLIVTASQEVLQDILELRRDPNEPYMFGELTVQGAEEHFMRLDYIVTMLCPA